MNGSPWLQQTCAETVGSFSISHDVTLSADWTVVFGPSGTGKSTWLRMLAGLLPQRTGTLLLHGAEIRTLPPHRRRVALVEQSPALFPHRNVEQNVGFACRAEAETPKAGIPEARTPEALELLLGDFHLLPHRRAAIATLSGGERQRVAIARALCSRPRLLLLDEVFTGMDTALRTDLIATLQRYRERMHLPIISVTHDVSEAFATADEVLRMRDGEITAQGPPAAILATERTELIRQLSR